MKKLLTALCVVLAVFMFASCNNEVTPTTDSGWVAMIYMDMCNLPAVDNLNEIAGINEINDNAHVYIMTGGSATEEQLLKYGSYLKLDVNQYSNLKDDTRFSAELAKDPKSATYYPFITAATPGHEKKENEVYQYWELQKNSDGNAKLVEITSKFNTKTMNDSNVLEAFMNRCWELTDKPTEKKFLLNIWNHGGGSYEGVCSDYWEAKYLKNEETQKWAWSGETESMYLEDLKTVLTDFVSKHKKLEVINFDLCLMSSVEDAYALKDVANYINASETTSAGPGTYYAKWVKLLYSNPTAEDFCKTYCGTAIDKLQLPDYSTFKKNITWSMIDTSMLSDTGTFMKEYNNFIEFLNQKGKEALVNAIKGADFANHDPKLNGGSDEESLYLYLNYMYDIVKLAEVCGYGEDNINKLKAAIDTVVTYKVLGDGVNGSATAHKDVYPLYGLSMCIVGIDNGVEEYTDKTRFGKYKLCLPAKEQTWLESIVTYKTPE